MTLTDNDKLDLELALNKGELDLGQRHALLQFLKADHTAELREETGEKISDLEAEIESLKRDLLEKSNELDEWKDTAARRLAKIENAREALR